MTQEQGEQVMPPPNVRRSRYGKKIGSPFLQQGLKKTKFNEFCDFQHWKPQPTNKFFSDKFRTRYCVYWTYDTSF